MTSHDRPSTLWTLCGLLLLTFVVLSAMSSTTFIDDWFYRPTGLLMATSVVGLAAVILPVVAVTRERAKLRTIPRRLAAAWREPPGHWPAFLLGVIIALPLLGFFTSTLPADTDSLRLVGSIRHVQRGNYEFLVDTQDSFGPHLILGPAYALWGVEGLRLVTIISVQFLTGVVAWLTRRISGSMLAALIAAVALLSIPPIMSRTIFLPMYPVMLALGSLGSWLAYRVIVDDARWYYAPGAAFLLVLAQEAHAVGQLLLAVPLLLLVAAPTLRQGIGRAVHVYAYVFVFALPRIIVNFSEGGLSHFRNNRTDYWVTKGYLRLVQTDFWDYAGLDEPYHLYLLKYPWRFVDTLGVSGWAIAALAVVAVLSLRGRQRWVVLAFTGLIVASMTILTIQPNPRYFSPLWPGMVALAGVAAAKLLRSHQLFWRLAGAAAVTVVVVVFFTTFRSVGIDTRELSNAAEERGYNFAVDFIDDDKAVIGVRSTVLLAADPEIRTVGGTFLSEEDYVTYLTWPSDAEVLEMMERNDIGWVMTTKQQRLDTAYNDAWLIPSHGRRSRHIEMLQASPAFCHMNFEGRVGLFKVGECASPEGAS